MPRGRAEITRLGVAMGGRPETFAGLTGMGDLIATCTSPLSRNRHVGVELGKGRPIDESIAGMNMVAEGVKSEPTVMALADNYGLDMPSARDVFDVTQGDRQSVGEGKWVSVRVDHGGVRVSNKKTKDKK